MRWPSYKALVAAALLTVPFLGAGALHADQYALDFGNGYAQNVEADNGFLVGDTYAIFAPAAPAPVASSETFRPVAPQGVQGMITDAAARYGLSAERMLRVARCESGFNAGAIGDSGASHGVFQFQRALWSETPQGRAGLNRLDAKANIEAAAHVMSTKGYGPWTCK